ncbi:MAG TPA: hypothetical protein PKW17_10805 [Smithellaceae bacterium]|nr:hypothetical protein [Smithellaceae bacterium]
MGNYAMGIVTSVAKGISGSGEVYGIYYEAKQQQYSYELQEALTWREKQEAIAKIELKRREAAFLKQNAKEAGIEAGYIERIGEKKLKMQQKKNDATASAAFARMAKSGVAMNWGSPEVMLDDLADAGASDYAWVKFQSDVDTWQAQRKARGARQEHGMALAGIHMMEQQLPLYDLQAKLFHRAARESGSRTNYLRKQVAVSLNNISSSLSSFGGGMGGS